MHSLFTPILLALSFFQAATVLAIEINVNADSAPELAARQNTMPLQCMEYSRIANMSTIGANSTYRGPFMAASPAGTSITARMLDSAIAKLPAMTADAALNTMCGNLTAVALTEAERNFTQRIVGQFSNLPPTTVDNGLAVVLTTAVGIIAIAGSALLV